MVGRQFLHRVRLDRQYIVASVLDDEMPDQRRDVALARAQRGHMNLMHAQPEVQFGPERPRADGRLQIAVGCRDYTPFELAGRVAAQRTELMTELSLEFGAQAVVLAIDARRSGPDHWHVYTRGGRDDEGMDAVAWAARGEELGAGEILLTSMDTDGVQDGFDCALTSAISRATRIPIIASGGAGTPGHFVRVLTDGCADAALAASIFHYGTYTVNQLKEELRRRGIPVRLA